MNFGISDIDQKFGGHRSRYSGGVMTNSRNPESTQYPKERGLLYGNGCYLNPADPDKPELETGCFTCRLKDCKRTDYKVRKHTLNR
jgi:hypothetical protein